MNTATASEAPVLKLPVTGMSCASCGLRVERALEAVPGVREVRVNLATEEASVRAAVPADAAALAAAVRRAGYGVATRTHELQVNGMSCASCVGRVEKALRRMPGVVSASVNLATERATVEALPALPAAELEAALVSAGYAAHEVAASGPAKLAHRQDGLPVLLAVLLTLPLVAPMVLQPLGVDAMLDARTQWVLATLVQFGLGGRFYRAGWRALRAGTGNMDLLVALGTSAAYGLSTYLLARHAGHGMPHLYF